MAALLSRDDYLREVTHLRAKVERLTREIEWLHELYTPQLAFPSAWALSAQQSAMLAALYARKGYLTKEALHHAINGDEPETDQKLVDVIVHHLRRKLGPFLGAPIETLWGRGYALTTQARVAIAAALAGGSPGAATEGSVAFEKIIVGLKKPKRLATLRLADKNATGRPRCLVALRRDFVDLFGLKAGDKLEVQIGTGDDAGRMRFARANDGVTVQVAPRGAATLALGHVPALGEEALEKTPIDVRIIDDKTMEIALPAAAGEAAPHVAAVHMTSLELVLGKSRIAKLTAAAQEAGEPIEKYTARLFASLIDDDAAANQEAA